VFLEVIERQMGVQESLQERSERQMNRTNLLAKSAGGYPGASSVPAGLAVARIQPWNAASTNETRMGAVETGMGAGIDEDSARPKNTGAFPDQFREIVNICMGEHRSHGIEALAREWKLCRVRSDKRGSGPDPLPREAELVGRDVDPCYLPAELEEMWQVQASAAAKVEATPRSPAEQPVDHIPCGERSRR
jgi:hypothetical protein